MDRSGRAQRIERKKGKVMTPQEEKQISEWNAGLSDEIQIQLMITEDERTKEFRAFCDMLSRLAPNVRIKREKEEGRPGLKIGKNLYYHAIPLGMELSPFLEILAMPKSVAETQNSMPADLKLYVSQHCPFCPQAVLRLARIASAHELVRLMVIDGELFPEMAEKDEVQSAPTLLLEDMFRWSGSMPIAEILRAISDRDPAKLGAASLENMLSEGKAFKLSQMMLDHKMIFPAFFDLLTHAKWQIRLGAMAAAEEIIDKDKVVAETMIAPLWEKFESADDQIKGDILYVFGQIGSADALMKAEKVLHGTYSDQVREAAEDAMI
jgi:glutaredoxin